MQPLVGTWGTCKLGRNQGEGRWQRYFRWWILHGCKVSWNSVHVHCKGRGWLREGDSFKSFSILSNKYVSDRSPQACISFSLSVIRRPAAIPWPEPSQASHAPSTTSPPNNIKKQRNWTQNLVSDKLFHVWPLYHATCESMWEWLSA